MIALIITTPYKYTTTAIYRRRLIAALSAMDRAIEAAVGILADLDQADGSNLMSWSSSLLFALKYGLYRHTKEPLRTLPPGSRACVLPSGSPARNYAHSYGNTGDVVFGRWQPVAGSMSTSHTISLLNYEDIFLSLFPLDSPRTSTFSQSWSLVIREGEIGVQLLEDSFAALEKYSFLQRLGGVPDCSMHRLVHAWGHGRLGDDLQDMNRFCLAASRLLEEAVTSIRTSSTPQAKLRLVPYLKENFDKVRWLLALPIVCQVR
jgi:hypothetical protein